MPTQLPRRNFQKGGKWIEKPTATVVLVCVCGLKYIKTRKFQKTCLRCLAKISLIKKV